MRRATTYAPAPFPAPAGPRLVEALRSVHRAEPFGPGDVRETARRVVDVAVALGFEPVIVRGGVDVGGAELDHVFVVVEERVVDVALPLHAAGFVAAVRAWVAGDIDASQLTAEAARYGLDDRVVGEYPAGLRYRGAPLWGTAA